ncbi:hypothetical protein ABT096_41495 [Streptomyces sp. NPDC002561]|uniref:hypothetical protein n=1 Tax=Streptomyces sp. NPDC002561 TaxID=3154418 RepID=UPI003325D332
MASRPDRHDDRTTTEAALHQEKPHRDVLVTDAAVTLRATQAALDLLPGAVTDVDPYTYRGQVHVTPVPAAVAHALSAWGVPAHPTIPGPSDEGPARAAGGPAP